jgi:hypothetical protein
MTETAVLLLIFRRPGATARVMEAIRAAQPTRLYVAADGARDRAGEAEECAEARRIATAVDWPCTMTTLFRQSNLGLQVAISSALDWFFEQEDQGIIIEDDCVPSSSFFRYCSELLSRYRFDTRIMSIGGGNYTKGIRRCEYSYYMSPYFDCWGWATWRRAWSLYDAEMRLWPQFRDRGMLKNWSSGITDFEDYWTRVFDDTQAGFINTWCYKFLFSCWAHGGLTCSPKANLVANIGYDPAATHTKNPSDRLANMSIEQLDFPLAHPPFMYRDIVADSYMQQTVFSGVEERGRHRILDRSVGDLVGVGKDFGMKITRTARGWWLRDGEKQSKEP